MTTESHSGPSSEAADLELSNRLIELLEASSLERAWWEEKLDELHAEHGEVVYQQLLYLLTHIQFSGEEATRHWRSVRRRRISSKYSCE